MYAGWIQWCITYTRCYFERCRGYVEQRIKHFRHIITSDLSDKCDIEYEKRVFVFHVNRVTANCQWCQCKGQLLQWGKTGGPDPLPPGFNPPTPTPAHFFPIFSGTSPQNSDFLPPGAHLTSAPLSSPTLQIYWYGCQTWYLVSKWAQTMAVEWNKTVRSTLGIPYTTYTAPLPGLTGSKPFKERHLDASVSTCSSIKHRNFFGIFPARRRRWLGASRTSPFRKVASCAVAGKPW